MGTLWSAEYGSPDWERQQSVMAELKQVGRELKYQIRAIRHDGPPKFTDTCLVRRTGIFGRSTILCADTIDKAETVRDYILNNRATPDWRLKVQSKPMSVDTGMFVLEAVNRFRGGDRAEVERVLDEWEVEDDDRIYFLEREETEILGYLPIFDSVEATTLAQVIETGATTPVGAEEAVAVRNAIVDYAKRLRSQDLGDLLESTVWSDIRALVPADTRNRIEQQATYAPTVADLSQATITRDEMQLLLQVVAETAELSPEQKLQAAHVLLRAVQGKEVQESEIPLMRQLMGDEFAESLRKLVVAE